jgi:threonine aldolase
MVSRMIDLRSDTVTRPGAAMRAAMMDAPLGDDVFRDDPTVLALEARGAELLGKEAGLFVPTGTMANQIALRVHCRHGDEVVAHRRCHIFNYETGAAAALAGVQWRPIDSDDGSMSAEAVAAELRISQDTHVANTALLAFENTHNACGGTVLDQALLEAAVACAAAQGVPAHLDGARLANAAIASERDLAELAAPFATVSLCLSKGLGAPLGSLLCGDAPRIERALRLRKMYGGGMRQAGVVAAAGLYALNHHRERLAEDHRRASQMAEALARLPALRVEAPQTNLLFFELAADHPLSTADFEAKLAHAGVLIHGSERRFRAAFHLDIDDDDLERALAAIQALL